ncbi:hypothetical protein [Streptomyces sp. NPDC053048]|uniref:hypothetical protein n=1 Tax=Streptomyces sp. NPDC053048 TaxID=3365694 RepID=UPI0037CDDCA6
MAVDAEGFTRQPSIEHERISRTIPELLRLSLEQAGLEEVWNDRRFPASTGDGYVFGFDPSLIPFLVDPWLETLQKLLTELNLHAAGGVHTRVKVSLNVGPLSRTGDPHGGNGTPRNDTHRLLDSRPVRTFLAESSKYVTQLVAILSDRCYQDAVAGGYTGRHPHQFIEVPATVAGKQFEQRAWVLVPTLSGNLVDQRLTGAQTGNGDQQSASGTQLPPAAEAKPQRLTYRADRGNLNIGTVFGGQSVDNSAFPRDRQADRP